MRHSFALTWLPYRYADAPTQGPDGELVFAKPWEHDEAFPKFLDFLMQQEKRQSTDASEVRYAQTREVYAPVSPRRLR